MIEIPAFIGKKDCSTLIKMIDANHQPSTVTIGNIDRSSISTLRTSSTCSLDPNDPLVKYLHLKIAQYLDIDIKKGESLQGQRYDEGEYFKGHYDYFTGESYDMHCQSSGNRTHTLMIYLNDDFSGGGTRFVKLNKIVTPATGKALMWENCTNGVEQEQTLHEGIDVQEGKKYIITSWWRENEWNGHEDTSLYASSSKTHKDTIPQLTKTGFKVMKCPAQTWSLIQDAYSLLQDKKVIEEFEGKAYFIVGGESELLSMEHLPATSVLIQQQLQVIHEAFCGTKIEPSAIYGIRSYLPGAMLKPHTDRVETHHVSAIIVVDKDLSCDSDNKVLCDDWPLDIQGHDGQWRKVYADIGDIILYESAICEHGRKERFAGSYFRNLFVHYKLI